MNNIIPCTITFSEVSKNSGGSNPNCTILESSVFGVTLVVKTFANALWTFETSILVNNNVCEN